MEITKKMYLLAKEIVKDYELKEKPTRKQKPQKLELNFEFSDVLKKDIFNLWINYRKEIKKPINVKSTLIRLSDRFEKEGLDKCNFVVNQSIENRYTGLFWDNYKDEKNKINVISATEKLKKSLGL